jgi:hypothetical protein
LTESNRLTDALNYRKLGYNVIPIIPKGGYFDKYEKRGESGCLISGVPADGKKAEGAGRWKHWSDKQQTEEDIRKIFGDGNWTYHETKEKLPFNIGIIHGNVSRKEVESMELDHRTNKPKMKPTGSAVLDCDGEGVELMMEAILLSDVREKMLNTPRVKTPSGGLHYPIRYYIEKMNDHEVRLQTQSIYKNQGHNEIRLLANGTYSPVPPNPGYVFEKDDFDNIAVLTLNELNDLINLIKRVDKRAVSGPLWTDQENYVDLGSNQDEKSDLVRIGKLIYKVGSRHDFTLHYSGILKRYLRISEQDALFIIEAIDGNSEQTGNNRQAVIDTYRKPDNKITSITTFRKLLIDLIGEDATNEIITELMSFAVPERRFHSDKPDGKLLEIAVNNMEDCVFDQDKIPYALIKNKKTDSYEILELKGQDFDLNLSRWFVEDNNGSNLHRYGLARKDHKVNVIDTLTSLIKKPAVTLHRRSVWLREEKTVYYNQSNEFGEIIKITANNEGKGVETLKQNPQLLLFKKLDNKCKQVTPTSIDNLPEGDYLSPLTLGIVNYGDRIIYKCWLVALYFSSFSYPIAYPTAPEDSGKSTKTKIPKSLYDPFEDSNNPSYKERFQSLGERLDTDRFNQDDVNLAIWKSSFTVFDNVSTLTPELMDNFCQWVTGFKSSKRMLYHDTDMVEITGTRPIAISGVTLPLLNPDLQSRIWNYKIGLTEQDKGNKTEEEFLKEFYGNKPHILAFIFKIISIVLARHDEERKTIKPRSRLPDFEILCEIIARCLGYKDGEFQSAWVGVREEQVNNVL